LKIKLIQSPTQPYLSSEICSFLKPEIRKSFEEQWKLFAKSQSAA
jgi:hypothetical protein